MMRRCWRFGAISMVIAIGAAAAAFADDAAEARKTFDAVYAQRVRTVRATLMRDDDIELAEEFLAAAQKGDVTEAIRAVFCEEAYALTSTTPDGYGVAAAAMQLLMDHAPGHRTSARQRLIEILIRRSRTGAGADAAKVRLMALYVEAGDEHAAAGRFAEAAAEYRRAVPLTRGQAAAAAVRARIEYVSHRQRIERRIAALRAKLLKDATDAASADELIRLHIVELNDPAAAAKFISRAGDAELKPMAALAAKDIAEIDADAYLALGEWHRALSNDAASPVAKAVLLTRAKDYLSRYVESNTTDDAGRTRATLQMNAVSADLDKLPPSPFQPLPAVETGAVASNPPASTGAASDALSLNDLDGKGMIGRAVIDGTELPVAFVYVPGKVIHHSAVDEQAKAAGVEMVGITIKLQGYLKVTKPTAVKIWHAGGSAAGGVNRMYLDDKEISAVGDDRTKNTVYKTTLMPGIREIRWVLRGGQLGSSLLQIFDAESMQPLDMRYDKNDLLKLGKGPVTSIFKADADGRVSRPKGLDQ